MGNYQKMKQIKKEISWSKKDVYSSCIIISIFLLFLLVLAIVLLVKSPHLWWVSLILFAIVVILAIILIFNTKYSIKNIKAREKELEESGRSANDIDK